MTEGLGPDKPVDTNDTKAGRANNRRIEFEILTQKPGRAVSAQPSCRLASRRDRNTATAMQAPMMVAMPITMPADRIATSPGPKAFSIPWAVVMLAPMQMHVSMAESGGIKPSV